jgi:hypothetical protein
MNIVILDGFTAKVTPASGKGAIRVKNGYAQLSGIIFNHVGPLGSNQEFTQQPQNAQTIDLRVDGAASVDLYSAIGRRFFKDKIDGISDEYRYIITN